jgi:hypothetical protein
MQAQRFAGAAEAQQSRQRGSRMHKQVEVALADPVFDQQWQISREFFWS